MVQSNAPAEIYQYFTSCSSRLTRRFGGVCTCAATAASPRCTACPIAFDWSDFHLHRFVIRGKEHGVTAWAGLICSSPHGVSGCLPAARDPVLRIITFMLCRA